MCFPHRSLQVWSIFRRDGSVVTVQEGDGLQLYCATLVRKSRADDALKEGGGSAFYDHQGPVLKKGGGGGGERASRLLRWTGSNPGAKQSEATMDLSSQVRDISKIIYLVVILLGKSGTKE